ncbi:MAG: glycosyltransferase family 2 protein [Muribaculaceae bacterium]|nr:glycosyltransferase family 2 protein [Muribaculaceae bacterium]
MPKVSVISPIYGVESFIAKSAESMMLQTLGDVEFIFVNDCTKDRSIEILNDVIAAFPERAGQVKILNHDVNKGLPAARNTGLDAANGDFIFHWDSDDYAERDMLERMYRHAVEKNADIVWCDWYLTFSSNERKMAQPDYSTAEEALRGMLGGGMKYNVWNKLAKRSLYTENNIHFPDGYGMGEDMTMMLLFIYANKVSHLGSAFYHYLKTNSNAFSNCLKTEHFESLKRNVEWIAKEIGERTTLNLDKEIAFLKLESKYPLIVASGSKEMYKLWNSWFPEANKYISQNSNVSSRSRFVQKMAARRQYWAVWLHYVLVCKIIYGLIYK